MNNNNVVCLLTWWPRWVCVPNNQRTDEKEQKCPKDIRASEYHNPTCHINKVVWSGDFQTAFTSKIVRMFHSRYDQTPKSKSVKFCVTQLPIWRRFATSRTLKNTTAMPNIMTEDRKKDQHFMSRHILSIKLLNEWSCVRFCCWVFARACVSAFVCVCACVRACVCV